MFSFMFEDLLLKEKITLYSNIAQSGDCVGRLQAELEVYPAPRIKWEFESLGDECCSPSTTDEGVFEHPIVGKGFSIEKPVRTAGPGSLDITGQQGLISRGIAADAGFGDMSLPFTNFNFYLPNARFQQQNITGQGRMESEVIEHLGSDKRRTGSSPIGQFIVVPLDECWFIRLETSKESLDWLDPHNRNIGTLLTTKGKLYLSDKACVGVSLTLPDVLKPCVLIWSGTTSADKLV